MSDMRTCRICLDIEAPETMVSPCQCTGTHRWVHPRCLRQWQRTVQIYASTQPQAAAQEQRHALCSVCSTPFTMLPESRADLLAGLAALDPAALGSGTLLVASSHNSSAATAPLRLPAGVPRVLRLWLEIKRAHWARSVYLLYDVAPSETADGDDQLLGINLTRTMMGDEEGEAAYAALRALAGRNCRLLDRRLADGAYSIFNGGPVAPRQWIALCALPGSAIARLPQGEGLDVICGPSAGGDTVLVIGPVAAVLELQPTHASFFSGHAVWGRTQLLGECARGSWGVCSARAEDALPPQAGAAAGAARSAAASGGAARYQPPERLYESVIASGRPAFAPRNEVRDAYEAAGRRREEGDGGASAAAAARDPQQRSIGRLIGVFESLRRQMRGEHRGSR
eukprot:TRINITY_DN17612_c0_g1_i1.p1 TRINITY_DN17612_c0_g1~~TRINITY_DN17612_c0_g1_i1.p1  ORF type:complete len:426 (+),score=135.55 TRINITY_DN17612_c0_g1_i1:90-1280(+)